MLDYLQQQILSQMLQRPCWKSPFACTMPASYLPRYRASCQQCWQPAHAHRDTLVWDSSSSSFIFGVISELCAPAQRCDALQSNCARGTFSVLGGKFLSLFPSFSLIIPNYACTAFSMHVQIARLSSCLQKWRFMSSTDSCTLIFCPSATFLFSSKLKCV